MILKFTIIEYLKIIDILHNAQKVVDTFFKKVPEKWDMVSESARRQMKNVDIVMD